ncbi:sialin [Galendromus occidentalis]|uniref:Sialin n=1 Tax=Galendromus occidentalis TaxID=34638 RepID=A0AAJ6QQ46_9ACAR|nr:sialin [Galendromus occidentalis]
MVDQSVEERVFKTRAGFIKHRYVICMLVFTGLALVYAMRVNLGVAIISMARSSADANKTSLNGVCSSGISPKNGTPVVQPEFDWDSSQRDFLLGAFFYGYISTQIPGGIMAAKLSIKWVFGYGVFLTSLLTIATHFVARWSLTGFVVLRILEGITEGVTFPSLYCLVARWAPESERTTMTTLCVIGTNIGTVITMPITAALASSSLGWPSSFYLPGAAGVLWSLVWYICATSQPENHRWISDEEREYIIKNRGTSHNRSRKIPWLSILTSRPVWMFAIARMIGSITFYMFLTEMPSFVDEIFGVPAIDNGVLNGFFYVLYATSSFGSGILSDYLIRRNFMSRSNVRKLFECSSFVSSGAMLLIVTQLGCSYTAVAVVLCFACSFVALNGGGDAGLALDLAPELAGSVMGFGNMVGNVGAIIATQLVSISRNPENAHAGWNLAFIITALASFFGAILFAFLGTAEEQPWAKEESDEVHFVDEAAEEEISNMSIPKRYSIQYATIQ